jgi:aromatic ring-opening dioxygenase catalytic subunit (LigB family)
MSSDIWRAAEALQNARDHLVIASGDLHHRDRRVRLAVENVRDAMKELGIKEAPHNGN